MKSPFMDEAFALAREGLGRVSPNPAVGAVIVQDGQVVGRGFHTWRGVKHAEIVALDQAGPRARGATVYVTLEPCSHQGRTGPCADALIRAGVARVVAAMKDVNPQVSGQGFTKLRAAGIEVEWASDYEQDALKLNEAFVHAMRTGLPLVTLKSALTLDGKLGARQGDTGWITGEKAREHVQMLRHHSDAILTGIGTVLADDPLLTDRTGLERSRPLLRIVLDSNLRTPLNSRLVSSANDDLLIATTAEGPPDRRTALEQRGVKVGQAFSLPVIFDYLADNQYRSLLVEAGPKVNGAFLDAGLADKVFLYYATKILGGDALSLSAGLTRARADAIRLKNVWLSIISEDVFALEGYVHRNH
ncbi:MAG TPA: bifunctional diaminohydroxyphosphoribosylaminopyrimidine deaminase/5-amino-6-(5-phosphoribosylamino)uracil reductase RibD [Bryobacteraceae bacterium]|nr:bifunctional diaminohydroxyphosphoribosylaminopyrimidine deaminase/5-amino-6-(5-phosphoribosylamino)uracil reductase RibD [Bryobacteraceae bacterium]